jgi:hypothetical protein
MNIGLIWYPLLRRVRPPRLVPNEKILGQLRTALNPDRQFKFCNASYVSAGRQNPCSGRDQQKAFPVMAGLSDRIPIWISGPWGTSLVYGATAISPSLGDGEGPTTRFVATAIPAKAAIRASRASAIWTRMGSSSGLIRMRSRTRLRISSRLSVSPPLNNPDAQTPLSQLRSRKSFN